MGPTLTVVETTDGHVIGGYSNTSWKSTGGWESANEAFLFALSGDGLAGPVKLELKDRDDGRAIFCNSMLCPCFGNNLCVHLVAERVSSHPDDSYKRTASWPLQSGVEYEIKEVEVFQVSRV